jgi:hypothetical protein
MKNSLKLGYLYDEESEAYGLYLPEEDRATHIYVIGSTGVGKSKALANWILDDIRNQRGCGVIDPHGDLIRDIVSYLPEKLQKDVILVELTDPDHIIGFNPLDTQDGIDPYLQTLELVEVFRKIWELSDEKTPRLLEILRNSIYTLIEAGRTMLDIEPLLTNSSFREEMIKYVKNEAVALFWRNRFERWPEKERTLYIESTLNKVSTFTSDPRIRLMLSSKESTISLRRIMDEGKALLVNLSKGILKTNSYLLGALFISKIQMAAMSRVDLPPDRRKPFYLYVDEFQNFATYSFAEIMSEARKYGLSLTLAHQSLSQLDEKLKSIILGNAKNFICFRLDREDAELLAKYIFEVDPLAWKVKYEDKYEFFSVQEQWEEAISVLTNLSQREAVLKTKGCDPTFFFTEIFHPPDELTYKYLLEQIRLKNRREGFTKSLKELDEALTFESPLVYEPDEPEEPREFWE